MELQGIREQIDDIDNQIFSLIKDRIELAKKVVVAKSKLGQPIYNAEREKFVVGDKVKKAQDLGLQTEFVSDIYKSLIKGCTQIEEELKD